MAILQREPEAERFARAIEADPVRLAQVARLDFRRYGRGRHPAGLNFGDCAVYTLAARRGERLLFKGEDFARTDAARAAAAP